MSVQTGGIDTVGGIFGETECVHAAVLPEATGRGRIKSVHTTPAPSYPTSAFGWGVWERSAKFQRSPASASSGNEPTSTTDE